MVVSQPVEVREGHRMYRWASGSGVDDRTSVRDDNAITRQPSIDFQSVGTCRKGCNAR
jgi:hypothetical protein